MKKFKEMFTILCFGILLSSSLGFWLFLTKCIGWMCHFEPNLIISSVFWTVCASFTFLLVAGASKRHNSLTKN